MDLKSIQNMACKKAKDGLTVCMLLMCYDSTSKLTARN